MRRTICPKMKFRSGPHSAISAALLVICLLLAAGCSSNPATNAGSSKAAHTNNNGSTANDGNSAQPQAEQPAADQQPSEPESGDADNPYLTAGIEDPAAFEAVFDQVKSAVAEGDQNKVADYVLFPMGVNDKKGRMTIKNKKVFIARYDAIFTDSVKKALEIQDKNKLFVNAKGVMVGNGEVWFGATASSPQKYGIIAINHDTEGSQ